MAHNNPIWHMYRVVCIWAYLGCSSLNWQKRRMETKHHQQRLIDIECSNNIQNGIFDVNKRHTISLYYYYLRKLDEHWFWVNSLKGIVSVLLRIYTERPHVWWLDLDYGLSCILLKDARTVCSSHRKWENAASQCEANVATAPHSITM